MNQQYFTIENSIQYLQEYQGLQNYIIIKLNDENNNRYKYPVNTLQCNHTKYAYNLETILQSINQKGYFICNCKNITVKHPRELQKDIRWKANEEINSIFDDGLIIHNHVFNQFQRSKKYNLAIQESSVLQQIKIFMESQNSINIKQILQKISNNNNQKEIIFKTICLLDCIQINFPVRFNECQHPECYDLASLLIYQKENSINQRQNDQLKQFICKQRQCQVKVDISTQQKIFQNIYMDKELLKMIKKGLPTIYKFKYNPITFQIQQDCLIQDEVFVDKQIYQIYKQLFKLQFQVSDKDYQDYQRQVTFIAYNILQRTLDPPLQQYLKFHKYKTFPITTINQNIEQPARCINCSISQIMDLKSIIANFQSQKQQYRQQIRNIKCPLCQKEYQYDIYLPKILYFDQNLFDAQEQGLLEIDNQNIIYNGKKFMKEEFLSKQKLQLVDFKQYLQEKYQCQRFTFNLYCSSNSTILIKLPLILKNCPEQRIIEFETFYNTIQNYQINDYENKCLKFCTCNYCQNNPFSFKEFPDNVYFHEAIHKALIDFDKSKLNKNNRQFIYDFEFNSIIEQQNSRLMSQMSITIHQSQFRRGFKSLLDDEEYQKQFEQKSINFDNRNYQYQIIQNKIENGNSTLTNTQNGYLGNTKKETINQQMKTNNLQNKWGFEIIKTETQFKNTEIKILKGKATSEQN